MKPTVYIETTVPSFYYEVRAEPDMVARREWTREWWKSAVGRDELVTSAVVVSELERGDYPARNDCLALIAALPVLAVEPAVLDIAATYVARQVMPADPAGDALHLALASFHRCDFLVTWNCRHLANASKFGHIRRVNTLLGLYVPTLLTPLEMMAEGEP